MFCMKCGNQLKDGALYCEKCGTRVNSADVSSGNMITSQHYFTQRFNKPIKGTVLNIISFLITIIGICISLFSPYFKVGIKYLDDLFGSNKYTNAEISLFSMGNLVETVNKYLRLDGDAADAIAVLEVIFWICVIDIIVAAILLIIRFTMLRGHRYNTFSSYLPITPIVITIICLIVINKIDFLNAAMSYSMYVLIALFIANLVIRKLGTNFNYYEIDRIAQRSNPESGTWICESCGSGIWICESCGWKNSTADSHCRNCNAKY